MRWFSALSTTARCCLYVADSGRRSMITSYIDPIEHCTSRASSCGAAWKCMPRSVPLRRDRKSTRLNSSHLVISYAVFCLKKKKTTTYILRPCTQPLDTTSVDDRMKVPQSGSHVLYLYLACPPT